MNYRHVHIEGEEQQACNHLWYFTEANVPADHARALHPDLEVRAEFLYSHWACFCGASLWQVQAGDAADMAARVRAEKVLQLQNRLVAMAATGQV